ncbi:collagen-binding protein [Thermococcus guaymasensis DSM 11113]|uniref:Collagen-binding protein n=1 Tax=Thermococcus guaymasensis DSM 11113 TaxID=1432656 RepID=A0A0X1KI15_9EURY|nr:hypothetical protein [Thermococcus guaymasensis]AJC70909.1 collagen-binding protein [Thermococcus guaymasensis DSM 11113]
MKKLGVVLALLVLFGSMTWGYTNARTLAIFSVDFSTDTSLVDTYSTGSWVTDVDLEHWFLDAICQGSKGGIGYDDTKKAFYLKLDSSGNTGHHRARVAILKENITNVPENLTVKMTIYATTNRGAAVGAVIFTKSGIVYSVMHYGGDNWEIGTDYGSETMGKLAWVDNDYRFNDLNWTAVNAGFTTVSFSPFDDLAAKGVQLSPDDVDHINVFFGGMIYNDVVQYVYLKSIEVTGPGGVVTFYLKDGLTGQGLTEVTVKESDGSVLGVLSDGDSLELPVGTYVLTFEKSGYWTATETINVQGDMTVTVELYPTTAAFMFKNFPTSINVYENTIHELTFTISPINTNSTYATYMSISGLSNVLEVRREGSIVSPEGGKYYLGDISGPTQVSIKFKASSVGTYAFSITLESSDAFGANTYTATKQVTYTVNPLPFSIQMPSEWQVGDNELRISEASGQSYSMIVILKDSSGAEVWSGSYAFSPYEVHTFTVNVPQEGTYMLEFQWAGKVASYTINVGTGITLLTKSVSVKKGGVGTVQVQLKNPSDATKYYTIKLEGGFLDVPVNQTVAIAPSSTKTVSIAFAVPDNVQFDAYDLTLKVLEGDAVRYSDTVHVIITGSEGSGLLPIGGGSSGSTLLLLGAAAAVGLVAILAASRRG